MTIVTSDRFSYHDLIHCLILKEHVEIQRYVIHRFVIGKEKEFLQESDAF